MKRLTTIAKKTLAVAAAIGVLFFFSPTHVYATSVPFDVATASAASPMTHGAGASATVAAGILVTDGTSCTATYGGTSMKKVMESTQNGRNFVGFYLAPITSGSQTVAFSCSGSTYTSMFVHTYTGGPYSEWPDSVAAASKANGVGTTLNIPLTTVADNVIGFSAALNGGVAFVAAAGMTFRSSLSVASRSEDNTDLFTPPGTLNMAWDNNGNTTNIEGMAIGIALSTSTPAASTLKSFILQAFWLD